MKILSSKKLLYFNSVALFANAILFAWLVIVLPRQLNDLSKQNDVYKYDDIEGAPGDVAYNSEGVVLSIEKRVPAIGLPKDIMLAIPAHAIRCDIGDSEFYAEQGAGLREISIAIGLNHQAYATYTSNGFYSPKVHEWQITIANMTYVDRKADGIWDLRITTDHAGDAESLRKTRECVWYEGTWKTIAKSKDNGETTLKDGSVVEYNLARGTWEEIAQADSHEIIGEE